MSDQIFSPDHGLPRPTPPPTGITSGPPVPGQPRRRRVLGWLALGVGLLLLLAIVGGGLAWWLTRPRSDMLAAIEANNRGVGLMEQFDYEKAIPAFEEVVRQAPGWQPGHINLGIAQMNATGNPENIKRARQTFQNILRKDPDNPHAHFCLGIILMYEKDSRDAIGHFEAVLRKDPDDAASWYWLGSLQEPGSPKQTECYERALKFNPHLRSAIYGLSLNFRQSDPKKADALLAKSEALQRADWENKLEIAYGRMGHYADVIGRAPSLGTPRTGPIPLFQKRESFSVRLADGVKWATAADFGKDAVGQLRARVRARFGGTLVVLDYNHDGKPDVFLAGAVVEKEQIRDLLLRNDGEGRFVDVTADASLADPRPTLGCTVADFDNDGLPDLLLTGAGVQRLFRNTGKGTFEDVTARAHLDEVKTVCLGAAFIDLDQDADLDILLAQYASTPEDALKRLEGDRSIKGGGLAVFLHVGQAPPIRGPGKSPPLEPNFKRDDKLANLAGGTDSAVGLAASDMDSDRDLDCLVLADGSVPSVVVNNRLLQFARQTLAEELTPPADWNGAIVLDVDHDGRSDLLLVRASKTPSLLLNRRKPGETNASAWFEEGRTNAPVLRQAVAIDLDMDTWTDIVGLSGQGVPVLLHNEVGRLVMSPDALGRGEDWPRDLIGLAVANVTSEGVPDILAWSESQGLLLHEGRDNGNHAVRLRLAGRNAIEPGGTRVRCNMDGIGTWVVSQTSDLWAGQENTSLSAGLGQSREPLLLGLSRFSRAELVTLNWPDGVLQAELSQLAGPVLTIEEKNRRTTSCPVLFAWDGKRFAFVTDFLGAGSVGEIGPDRTCRPPRSEESVKIEAKQLVPRDGQYELRIAEPMDEVCYLDYLELVAIDHPADMHVYPDERFVTAGPPPSQQLVAFRKEVYSVRAVNHRGQDVTAVLRHRDRHTVDDFAKRSWIGFAEEHFVELDFGDRLSAVEPDERVFLCLAGWTDYPYPESIWAAHQAGIEMQPPVLERMDVKGRWQSLGEAGFPAGLPRMMLREVTGQVSGPRCRLRLRTNMQIYWDQAFIAVGCRTVTPGKTPPADGARATRLEVGSATLSPCGIMQEYSPDGRPPTQYDHDRYESVPLVRLAGRMTRFGDVAELLRTVDDRFVIFGPGDEVSVRFDAKALPPLAAGWKRSFVLRTRGYCKDTGPFTATGRTVEPLPFRTMRNYPPGPDEHYPDDALHWDYRRKFNTREVKTEGFPARR
jgi:hypothetical protein